MRQFGCSVAQGFLLARPLSLPELMLRYRPPAPRNNVSELRLSAA
jgi:EAL domain-containing protein (putative c-di-GMP-specific phosphodiesterase class I)